MSTKDLAAKYGKNKNSTQAVNAAIRAELPGGSEALDALDEIRHAFEQDGLPQTGAALHAIRQVVAAMGAEIRRRYGMPPRDE